MTDDQPAANEPAANPIPPPDPNQDAVTQAQQIVDHSQQELFAKGNLGNAERSMDPNER